MRRFRCSYRYVRDSFGSDSHTVEAAWYQPLANGWSVKPALRYYTQAAADFYFDPPFPQGFSIERPYTADTRLSAFGALTPGITVAKLLSEGWAVDLKVEFYRQRSAWRPEAAAAQDWSRCRRAGSRRASARRSDRHATAAPRVGHSCAMPLFRFRFHAMASPNELQIWHDDESRARKLGRCRDRRRAAHRDEVFALSRRQHYHADQSCRRAGSRSSIDAETFALLGYADQCHRLSDGRFDITSGVLRRAWDFRRSPPRLPAERRSRPPRR